MVLCLKVEKADAERIRKQLEKAQLLSFDWRVGRMSRYVFLPILQLDMKGLKKKVKDAVDKKEVYTIEDRNLQATSKKPSNLREALKAILPERKVGDIIGAFDVIGDIAVLEIPKELEEHEVSIAWTLKRLLPNIKTVAKRDSEYSGKYRIRKIRILVGDQKSKTLYVEDGIRYSVDLNEVYFTQRLAEERGRIARLVKPKENVLVMFAGIGPYLLRILKVQPEVKSVVGVEWNPACRGLFVETLKLNKLDILEKDSKTLQAAVVKRYYNKDGKLEKEDKIKKIEFYVGDVLEVVPKLLDFDRIIMPHPTDAISFFELAIKHLKIGGVVHIYSFLRENQTGEFKDRLREICKKSGRKIKKVDVVKAGQKSPGVFRYCFDICFN